MYVYIYVYLKVFYIIVTFTERGIEVDFGSPASPQKKAFIDTILQTRSKSNCMIMPNGHNFSSAFAISNFVWFEFHQCVYSEIFLLFYCQKNCFRFRIKCLFLIIK